MSSVYLLHRNIVLVLAGLVNQRTHHNHKLCFTLVIKSHITFQEFVPEKKSAAGKKKKGRPSGSKKAKGKSKTKVVSSDDSDDDDKESEVS